jgi:hypothetical protein
VGKSPAMRRAWSIIGCPSGVLRGWIFLRLLRIFAATSVRDWIGSVIRVHLWLNRIGSSPCPPARPPSSSVTKDWVMLQKRLLPLRPPVNSLVWRDRIHPGSILGHKEAQKVAKKPAPFFAPSCAFFAAISDRLRAGILPLIRVYPCDPWLNRIGSSPCPPARPPSSSVTKDWVMLQKPLLPLRPPVNSLVRYDRIHHGGILGHKKAQRVAKNSAPFLRLLVLFCGYLRPFARRDPAFDPCLSVRSVVKPYWFG